MNKNDKKQSVTEILSAMDKSIKDRRIAAVFEIMESVGVTLEDLNNYRTDNQPPEETDSNPELSDDTTPQKKSDVKSKSEVSGKSDSSDDYHEGYTPIMDSPGEFDGLGFGTYP